MPTVKFISDFRYAEGSWSRTFKKGEECNDLPAKIISAAEEAEAISKPKTKSEKE